MDLSNRPSVRLSLDDRMELEVRRIQGLKTENENLRKEVEEAGVDPVTGAGSLQGFLKTSRQVLDALWPPPRSNRPNPLRKRLAMMVVDVDHLHDLNVAYGRPNGERILKQIKAALEALSGQKVYRCGHGADEFIILFPGTTCREAWKLFWDNELKKPKAHVRIKVELVFSSDNLTRTKYDFVTLSGGVTDYVRGEDIHDLEKSPTFRRAWWGVKQAKIQGRDLIWRVRTDQVIDEQPEEFVVTR